MRFNIIHYLDKWINKRYKKEYYGIKISKKEIDKFLNELPFQNKEKLGRIYRRFYEGVPERSNGIDFLNKVQA